MDLTRLDPENWHPIRGAGSAKTPEEYMTLAAELCVEHQHFDEASPVAHADGVMLNRHLDRERHYAPPPLIGPDYPGEDEVPTGAYISLAAQERGADGRGGELAGAKTEQGQSPDLQQSAHQREYAFLQQHVEQAYAAYQQSYNAWPSTALNDWQKVEALARYATRWKMRTAEVYDSFHPVDVLFHSSYCTGAANILQALAMLAGFDTRFIAISNHSTVEIHVNGRWIWADNIIAGGGVTPNTCNYAEMTSDPLAVPSFTDMQRAFYNSATARYRAPYSLAARYYWHFMSGDGKGRGVRDDVSDGYGLSLAYDPSTACALYPELKQHRFFSPQGWAPTVIISEKGSLVRATHALQPDEIVRKRFYIAASDDNPIQRAVLKLRLGAACNPQELQATFDGQALPCHGISQRFEQPCADFIIDAALLGPGQHEFVLSTTSTADCIFYPDPLLPYTPPHYGAALHLNDSSFSVEACIPPAQLAELNESMLSAQSVSS